MVGLIDGRCNIVSEVAEAVVEIVWDSEVTSYISNQKLNLSKDK